MQLFNSLRWRDVLFTENETIADLNKEKFTEGAKLPDARKYK